MTIASIAMIIEDFSLASQQHLGNISALVFPFKKNLLLGIYTRLLRKRDDVLFSPFLYK